MGDSSLGVAVLTAATAIVASLVATWGARAQARVEGKTRRAEAVNQRRREAQGDQETDDGVRRSLMAGIRRDARTALDDVEVSKAASELCFRAVLAHHALSALTDGRGPLRADYDTAYREYRRCEDRFLKLARARLGKS